VKGGVKLIMKEVVGLLKAEGISSLNLGVAVAQDVKPGEFGSGFRGVGERGA